jgi:predicted aspartyl protease
MSMSFSRPATKLIMRSALAVAAWFVLSAVPIQAREKSAPVQLPGYEAVPVHYGPTNKMIIRVIVNGHSSNFIVDTGAGVSALDSHHARRLGVTPVGPNSPFGQFTTLNGHSYQIGYIRSLKAGPMDFGNGPIALFNPVNGGLSDQSGPRNEEIDGIIGADILTHYKAIINCGTRTIFFKVNNSQRLQLAHFALAQHFVRIPLREEITRTFTVPASINGHACRLTVDTGAFVTTFDQATVKKFGISFTSIPLKGSFTDGIVRQVSLGYFKQLTIGDFPIRSQRLAGAALPEFALDDGNIRVAGILGMELLAFNHGIIDFESMSLFLK